MVDMQLSNKKLVNRGAEMIVEELNIDLEKATELLKKYGNVRQVLSAYKNEI
jgi:N-acetylmuramic acid 6-phosphate etherase